MQDDDPRVEPVKITTDADRGLRIIWGDAHVSDWPLDVVRRACPCAVCADLRARGEPVWPRPGAPEHIDVTSAELAGAFGISFHWNDGHQTGIYSWDRLRGSCPCDACRSVNTP